MLFKSLCPGIDVPSLDLPTFLFEYAESKSCFGTNPGLLALADGTQSLAYGELKDMATAFASGLVNNLALQRGDVVAVALPNTIYYPVVTLGAQMAGCVPTTANPAYVARELAHQLELTEAKAVVTTSESVPVVLEALGLAKISLPRNRVLTIDGDADNFQAILSKKPFSRVLLTTPDEAANTRAFIVFSSGTSGLPKGVQLSHRNLVCNILQNMAHDEGDPVISQANSATANQAYMACLPYFHIYALTLVLHVSIAKGHTQVVMPKFDLKRFCELSQQYKASVAHLVPPIILQLAKDPIVANYDLSNFVYINSGAAPLTREIQAEVQKRIKCPIVQAYGLSEAAPVTHRSPIGATPVGSVGCLLPSMECKILDEEGKECGTNQTGEICVRGPNVMLGYLKNPRATAEAIDSEGFLHTGDIGRVDKDGFYFVSDRKKELIKYKGFQIAPAELEGLLVDHPAVLDAAVIPVYDSEQATEVPKAFLVIQPEMNKSGTTEAIHAWMEARVVYYKRLRGGIEIVDAIPKSASGKILRRILKDREALRQKLRPRL
ncbi:4-coumarate-CoA ligase 2 [Martensiomyces pterosporus]|nr:4-coumarate-CoA ligase 2 [Martensiomyces pterosporus]